MADNESQTRASNKGAAVNSASTGAAESFFGKQSTQIDDWLAVGSDGIIVAKSGKVEVGTGTRTAIAQIVAEELDVSIEWVQVVMGDTDQTPDEGYTAGSMTIRQSGGTLRLAAADARAAMLEMASDRLDASPEELVVRDGIVSHIHHPDRSITYRELMGGKKFNREFSPNTRIKPSKDYGIVGKSIPRVDLPAKFTGKPSFIQDLRVPGMLHARVVHPPSVGANLVSIDTSSLADDTGPARLVRVGNFIGVASEREEQAVRAAKQIKIEWDMRIHLPHSTQIFEEMRAQQTNDQVIEERGDINAAFGKVKKELNSTYYQPFHAHASLAPACAIADVQADQVIVWCASPGPHPLKGALAQLLGVPAGQIHINYLESAGGYGQNGADDVAAEAVILSRELGTPVRLQWSREDEFVWEPKSAPMTMAVHGGIDGDGNIVAWEYNVWSPTHAARPRIAQQLLVFQFMNATLPPPARFYIGGERNAPTNYTFPNSRVTIHCVPNPYLRVSSFRSLGGMGNTFANESFIDELAFAAKMDPLEFRLRHLQDNRARDLLLALAERVNWEPHISSVEKQVGMVEGRGLAFAQYENEEALVACVADVQVDTTDGTVSVKRITVAHDCGLIINPDGLRNQIEGNVIQSLSRAVKEQVTFDESHITSIDWQTYPILTFSEIPDIDILLINRPDEPALGAGEPATITTAPAIGNAIFDATGARLYQMPFTPGRVKQALRTET